MQLREILQGKTCTIPKIITSLALRKIGNLFYIKKLILDIINVRKNNNVPFTGFYGLDASGSGSQILSMLLKDNTLASACALTQNNKDDLIPRELSIYSMNLMK